MEVSLVPSSITQIENAWSSIAGQLAETSKKTYLHDMRVFVNWMLDSGYEPQTLTYDAMIVYRVWLMQHYANSTAARMFSVAKRLLTEQVRRHSLESNPADGVRTIKTEDETTHIVLTGEEAERLLNTIDTSTLKGKRDYALLLLLLRLGLRRSECAGINVADISMDQGHNILIVRHGKGNKRRISKIPVDVKRELDTYLLTRNRTIEPLFTNVFRNDRAGDVRISDKQIYRLVKQYAKKAGVAKLSPHGLRGTFITLSLEANAPLSKVQYAAGHKDPRTTERYQKRKTNLDDNAVDFIKVRRNV
jgi:integrase/recombinase XerD